MRVLSAGLLAALTLAAAAHSAPRDPESAPSTPAKFLAAAAATEPPFKVSHEPAMPDTGVPMFWRTRAERTGYQYTSDYDETIRFCRQMEGGSRWVSYMAFGRSGQGRELPLLIVSNDRTFTPEAARAAGKAIVLVQCGIHSGEIEGKDAALALVRDIAVLRKRPELLDHVVLLVVPMLSPDAHERRSKYNRINQNGPDEMGWRVNPVGLNLNRDYVKLESVELRAMIRAVFTKWWPDLLVDTHTTDGSDYRYDLTYGIQHGAGVPAPIDQWMHEAIENRVMKRVEALGHRTAPYLEFRSGKDPNAGFFFRNFSPRFSHAYAVAQNRPGLLVETHMLKPYGTRVKATYDLLVAVLEELNARPAALKNAVAASEAATAGRARATSAADRAVVLASDTTSEATTITYEGVKTTWEPSDITGRPVPHYGKEPVDLDVPFLRETRATLTVTQPVGYVIPQEWAICRDLMDLHGIRYRRFAQAWTDSVDATRVLGWTTERLFEGHRPMRVTNFQTERQLRVWKPGDVFVPMDQPGATMAMQLFEPQAPDGLLYWNAFDTTLEYKEFAEDYVMEPIAKKMLAENPALKKAFEEKLASDSSFAKDPSARIDFFYRRSPWADPLQNLVPVTRALRAPPETVLEPVNR